MHGREGEGVDEVGYGREGGRKRTEEMVMGLLKEGMRGKEEVNGRKRW